MRGSIKGGGESVGIFLPHYCNTKKTLTDFSPQQIQRYIGISISRLHQGTWRRGMIAWQTWRICYPAQEKNLRGVSANTQVSDLRSLQIDTSARLL